MRNDQTRIEEPKVKRDQEGQIQSVRLVFGPHHFVEVYVENGRVQCAIAPPSTASAPTPPRSSASSKRWLTS